MRIFDLDNLQEIWVTISRNKLRSALTGFGVFWGIFMLIFLIGMGNGFESGVLRTFSGVAPNSAFFWTDLTSEPYKGYRKGRSWRMNSRDLTLITEKARSVEDVSPMIFVGSADKNVVRGEKSGSYVLMGVYPVNFEIQKQYLHYGRLINTLDIKENRKVCVLGREVYETLFNKGEDPTGQYIRANGIYFQVVGVVSPKSDASIGSDPRITVFIPFSSMQKAFNQGDNIHFLGCTAKPGYPASVVENEVKQIMKAAHDISPTDTKAINSFNLEEFFLMFQYLFVGVSILTWIVGMGALLSGIIGISNIMMVTVKERTREIGIRRALGAKPLTIATQIVSESFVLTALSGFLGMVGAIALIMIFNKMTIDGVIVIKMMDTPIVPLKMAIAAFIVLLLSGILAGLIPAIRALKIKAIDAIRDE